LTENTEKDGFKMGCKGELSKLYYFPLLRIVHGSIIQ
jgi:hypothetical protein